MLNIATKRARGMASVAIIALSVSACVQTNNMAPQTTRVEYYPACYEPVAQLRKANDHFSEVIAAGVVMGAMTGALTGVLANKGRDKGKGAAIGAIGGALAGGMAAYAQAKREQYADARQRMASYTTDMRAASGGLQGTNAAGKAASACYDREFKSLIGAVKAGTMSKEEGRKRYTEIKSGLEEVATLMGTVAANATKRQDEFQTALTQEAKENKELKGYTLASASATSTKKVSSKKPEIIQSADGYAVEAKKATEAPDALKTQLADNAASAKINGLD